MPTINGDIKPDAAVISPQNPKRTPAKLGLRSTRLANVPADTAPLIAVPVIIKKIAKVGSHPLKANPSVRIAPPPVVTKVANLRTFFNDILPLRSSQSLRLE